jgi:hypothetical protein
MSEFGFIDGEMDEPEVQCTMRDGKNMERLHSLQKI